MFDSLLTRAERTAQRRAAAQAGRLSAALADRLPGDIRIEADPCGVRLSGRGLKRRLASDPALKWTIAEAIR